MGKVNISTGSSGGKGFDESLKESLRGSIGELPAIVDEQIDAVSPEGEAEVQDFSGLSNLPEGAIDPDEGPYAADGGVAFDGGIRDGYTPEGDIAPLDDRANAAMGGIQHPSMQTNIPRAKGPQMVTHKNSSDGSPVVNMTGRSDALVENVTDNDAVRAITLNMHFPTDRKAEAQEGLAKKFDGTETEEDRLAMKDIYDQKAQKDNDLPRTLFENVPYAMEHNPEMGPGGYQFNPEFIRLMSLVTENHIPDSFLAKPDDPDSFKLEEDKDAPLELENINPVESAEKLGQDLAYWWGVNLAEQGVEPKGPLDKKAAAELGMFAMAAYQQTNPHLVKAVKNKDAKLNPDETVDPELENATRYELTTEGEVEFDASADARNAMFGIRVEPLHVKPEARGLPEMMGRKKPDNRDRKSMGGKEGLATINEAIQNQQNVNHVVDKRRLRIAFVLAGTTIFRKVGDESPGRADFWGDLFGVGRKAWKRAYTKATRIDSKEKEEATAEAHRVINDNKKGITRELMALVMHQKKPNYLTYAIQKLTGRHHAQQTDFNPTRNKIVRFATRGQTPTKVVKGSEQYNNMHQIFALNLMSKEKVDGEGVNDLLLPKERMEAVKTLMPKWYKMGKELIQLLDSSMTDAQMEELGNALRSGMPMDHPSFPKFQSMGDFGNNMTPALREYIQSKGGDATMAVESLIELVAFSDAMDAGLPHYTVLNAYIDGKTNGIAIQGMMLGIKKLAYLTGVLRPENAKYAVEQMEGTTFDVRDAMKDFMLGNVEESLDSTVPRWQESAPELIDFMETVAGYRELNKNISMIFPYGKEIDSMKKEVGVHLADMIGDNEKSTRDMPFEDLVNSLESKGIKMVDLIAAVHHNLASSLYDVFGEDTFEARNQMRQSSYMMAIIDKNLAFVGPTGATINLGGSKLDKTKTQNSTVRVGNKDPEAEGLDKSQIFKLESSPSYQSSAAEKDGQIGGEGRSRAVVLPVHAADAGIIAKLFSGPRMERIKALYKDAADFYGFQIYDAMKVDATNLAVIQKEINEAFVETSMGDWNYFREAGEVVNETYTKIIKAIRDSNHPEAKGIRPVSIGEGTHYDFLGSIINPTMQIDKVTGQPMINEKTGQPVWKHEGAEALAKTIVPFPAGMPKKKYNALVRVEAQKILNAVRHGMGTPGSFRINEESAPVTVINSDKLANVFESLMVQTDYKARVSRFVNKIEKQRAEMRAEMIKLIKKTGLGSLQYYAH